MSSYITIVKVDNSQFARYINAVTKAEKNTMKVAYKEAMKPIQKAARQYLTSSSYNLKSFKKGVRISSWKNSKGATAFIRKPDDNLYKLLFFEEGNYIHRPRIAKKWKKKMMKKPASRGNIKAIHFFSKAVTRYSSKCAEIFDDVLLKAIKQAEK